MSVELGVAEQLEVATDLAKVLFQAHLAKRGVTGVTTPPGLSEARTKLIELGAQQFQELVTDVYDEVIRRNGTIVVPFVSHRAEYSANRNHARQKLSCLVHTRFNDLVSDVLFELERRHTQFREPPDRRRTFDLPREPRPTNVHISEFSAAGLDLFLSPFLPLTISGYQRAFATASRFCLDGQIDRSGLHPLASGGYADVWKGSLGPLTVAIKVMRPFEGSGGRIDQQKLFKRLWREFLSWSSLSHENIIPCLGFSYDFCSGPDVVPALISPWMSNGTVRSYLDTNPDFSTRLKLLLGIAEGLSYLHLREPAIIHGDLRAGNALVNDSGIACLSDFGLSKMLSETRGMTTTSEVAGSLRWMAPELIRNGSASVTMRSDTWAYGMTVLEILSGSRPYHDVKNDAAVLSLIIGGELPKLPVIDDCPGTLSDALYAICHQCWEHRSSMHVVAFMVATCWIEQ